MCNHHRNPVQCIVPPYMQEKLDKKMSPKKLEAEIDNSLRSHRLRSDRKFMSALPVQHRRLMAVSKAVAKKPKPIIEVHSCEHGYSLPGKLLMATGGKASKDQDALNVYKGAMHTWELYYNVFNRNSIDNMGMAIIQSVHYGKIYKNAMWNGRQMIYGDGDKKVFDSFTLDIDIIGHELAHGLTQYAANLNYENESGALNESMSDVFGILVKQYALKLDVKKSNWLIGENIMRGKNYALRSMSAPGSAYKNHPSWGDDPQPATMDHFSKTPNTEEGDWGDVHTNSGIPNFAFYVAAYNTGGFAWEKVGKVWYAALTSTLKKDSNFHDAREATIFHASKLFGKGSLVEKAVRDGWKAAKVV